jgi:hypothetical protein
MRKKVYDIHWMICMSIWIVAVVGYLLSFIVDSKTRENTLYAFIVLFVLFIALLVRPVWVEFDKKSLTIHFLFGFFQKLNWDTVWKVERQIIPFDIRYYQVFGDSYGKKAFFTSSKIPYSRKTQRLLREYWNNDFEK